MGSKKLLLRDFSQNSQEKPDFCKIVNHKTVSLQKLLSLMDTLLGIVWKFSEQLFRGTSTTVTHTVNDSMNPFFANAFRGYKMATSQLAFTYSKPTIERLEKGVKYVQS